MDTATNRTVEKISVSETSRYQSYVAEYSRMGSSYMFSHILPGSGLAEALAPTLNFNGLMLLLILDGNLSVSINMEEVHARRDSLLLFSPRSVVDTASIRAEGVEAYMLFIAPDFFKGLSLDLNVLSSVPIGGSKAPAVDLTDGEASILRRELELIDLNTRLNSSSAIDEPYMRSIARNHLGAVLYMLMMLAARRNSDGMHNVEDNSPRSRRLVYTRQFLELLQSNFHKERSVSFYARRLFISPKYLSLVVKEMTGHSATELIDSFVIMEAKNQLRFSGKNIQQIAYDLNFSNQSAFGKYFKRITGQSPSEFQRS